MGRCDRGMAVRRKVVRVSRDPPLDDPGFLGDALGVSKNALEQAFVAERHDRMSGQEICCVPRLETVRPGKVGFHDTLDP